MQCLVARKRECNSPGAVRALWTWSSQSTGQASVSELASFHRPNTVFGLSACSVFLSRSSLFGLRSALAFLTSLVFIYQRIPVLESHVASRAESVRGAGSASSQPPRFVARCDRLIPKNSPNMGSLRSRVFLIYVVAPATVLLMLLGSSSGAVVKTQPVECESYSLQKCKTEGQCNVTMVKCESDSDKPSNCFVLWSNSTGSTVIEMKGCFSNNVACDQNECIDHSVEQRNNLNFCCCKGFQCNSQHKWIPTTTVPTEIEVPQKNTLDSAAIIGIVLAIGIVILLIVIGAVYILKQRKPSRFDSLSSHEPEPNSSSPCLDKRQIDLIQEKARGRFGTVWQGQMKAEEVAVKIFPMQDKESWQKEQDIYKLPRLKHPNILEFIGAEKHMQDFWIITAYHSNGSLCDYLKSHTITWMELCKIAESMARGLMHLHEEIGGGTKGDDLKPAIAHRDFKSKNVLLKDDLTACIADFGLAMIFEPGKPCGDTHGQVGTRRYMAPEVLEGAINFTRDAFLRIDVYACGLVLWEMVSRCDAHGGSVAEYTLPFESELGPHPTLEQMQENVVMKKLRPRINEKWRTHAGLSAICDTMEECWDHDAEARLSSSCVMERVSQHNRYPTTPLLIETNTDTPVKDSSYSI